MAPLLHSLRGRLVLLILVALLPALATLLHATFWLRERSMAQSEAQVLAQARSLVALYQEHVGETRRLLTALAQMADPALGHRSTCEALMREVRHQVPDYVANLAAVAPDGRLLCSARGSPESMRINDRPYFRQALAATDFAGGDHVLGRFTGQPEVIFTYTIRKKGMPAAILVTALDLVWLQNHHEVIALANGAAFALYDKHGTLLLSQPEREGAMGRDFSTAPFWPHLEAMTDAGTFRSVGEDGVERLYGYAPLGPAGAPYARLAVTVPVAAAFAEAGQVLQMGLLGLATAGLLGLLVGWFGGWALMLHPLQPIFDTVRRVAAGDLSARTGLPAGRAHEIHRLAAEVDRMAAALAAASEEHRRAAQAMARERDRAQAYLDVVGVMVVALDRDGNITLSNPKADRILGGCRGDGPLYGNWFDDFVAPERRDMEKANFARLMAGEMPLAEYHESEVLTCSGERRRMAWHNALLRDDEGRVAGILSAGEDITERRRLEEERAQLQRQLHQSQKMEALGQLTGGIAHDFNNILASILGFSKLALQRHVPDPAGPLAEYLGEVVAAGERGRDLVAKMLTFSRASPGAGPRALAPRPVVEEGLRMLASTIPASIRMERQLDPDLPDIAMAPVDVHQILMNLVINARDAMAGKGRMAIRLYRREVAEGVCAACRAPFAGDHVVLAVSDSGEGIAPEVLPRIFDPFFSTKEVGRGSGMGLAVVHGLVCRGGGHILVDSKPGQGSTFQVFLPVAPGTAAPAPLPEKAAPAAAPGKAGRVLVVDDEASIRRLLVAALEGAGWAVSAWDSPVAALAAFEQDPGAWDAVVTDEAMPDLTGAELTVTLRGIRPDLPVILCTGYSDQLDERTALQLGVRKFFRKPVAMEALLAELAEATAAA